jgi:hypothetical protein
MAKDTDVLSMYSELLDSEAKDKSFRRKGGNFDEEDGEVFVTSKELAKQKEEFEKATGSPADHDGVIEEEAHFKRYTKRRKHKYTEAEMEQIRDSCRNTIVHDYSENDIYHLSDEERQKNDMLAEMSLKLARLKRTYRRADQYIEAMRIVFEAWELLEKNNYLHTKDEFFELVAEGKIVSNRILMPKLKGMNRYNIDLLIMYISNPDLDASIFAPKAMDDDDFFSDETEEEQMTRLLSVQEAEAILNEDDVIDPPTIEVEEMKRKYIKGYDRRSKKKKGKKRDRMIRESVGELLRKIENSRMYRDYTSYTITTNIFDVEKEKPSLWDEHPMTDSWADEDAVRLYELEIQEAMMEQHPEDERYMTYGDKALQQFYRISEENGVNMVDMRRRIDGDTDEISRKKLELTKKENKKMEAVLIQRITKLNQSKKFKKLASRAESALENYKEET